MAKVMVSLPDDLLRDVDAEARRRGTTRSGFLRELAEDERRRRQELRIQRMREIQAETPSQGHGGNVAEVIKANRPHY